MLTGRAHLSFPEDTRRLLDSVYLDGCWLDATRITQARQILITSPILHWELDKPESSGYSTRDVDSWQETDTVIILPEDMDLDRDLDKETCADLYQQYSYQIRRNRLQGVEQYQVDEAIVPPILSWAHVIRQGAVRHLGFTYDAELGILYN